MDKIKLFCIPYAGGTASIYNKWKPHLYDFIELVSVELAGRGKRNREPNSQSIQESAEDVYSIVEGELSDKPYAIYGHSMGSSIAYELYLKINGSNSNKPLHMFFSGRGAPHTRRKNLYYDLPEQDFKREITKIGGIPEIVFENSLMYNYFIPVLRSDMKNDDTYKCEKKEKVDCSISVLNGTMDSTVQENDVLAWREYSTKCNFYKVSGDHFFLNENPADVVNIINTTLMNCITKEIT